MFANRTEAGEALADRLEALKPDNPVVLALPRGGVPVALPIARRLKAPLDLLMVRKLGMPGQPELAAGAVVDGAGHDVVFNRDLLRSFGLSERDFDAAIKARLEEIEARRERYLGHRPPVALEGRTAIVVDDGVATGATVKAALKALKRRGAAKVILALPVAPADSLGELQLLADRVICLETPEPFYAVGAHYAEFGQVEDDAVQSMLRGIWQENGDET